MDTSSTSSYVALSLAEIRQRFEQLKEEDLDRLSIEDYDLESEPLDTGYNPYERD